MTNLYAALDVPSGKVIGSCADRLRQKEYVEFLRLIDRKTQQRKALHLIVDNASSRDTKSVWDYLLASPGGFVVRFTPTHSSWRKLEKGEGA